MLSRLVVEPVVGEREMALDPKARGWTPESALSLRALADFVEMRDS